MKHTITILVENRAGALSKISGMFSRRGFNIDSLAVGVTENPEVSRMTIVVDCDESTIEQVEKQLNKLIDTIKVKVLPPGSFVARELTLARISCDSAHRHELMKIIELMNARIVDVTTTTMTVEFTDSTERTETLLTLLRPFGIKELVRTGASVIEKGGRGGKRA